MGGASRENIVVGNGLDRSASEVISGSRIYMKEVSGLDLLNQLQVEMHKEKLYFNSKPILIGGMAMEYYGMRKSGADIDFVVTDSDYQRLASKHPDCLKDLWGDLGVVVGEFEIWRSIALLDYDFYLKDAVDAGTVFVVSLDRLLFMRVIAMDVDKYMNDLHLMKAFYYENFRNKKYLQEAEKHTTSYQKHGGAIFGGRY